MPEASSIYVGTSSNVLGLFRAFVGASIYNPYAAKIGVWIRWVRRIKMIPEILF